jgi:UDP-N-acetylenolpyruvoylglucosamine reductase
MSSMIDQLTIERGAPIPTWFKVGGRADRFVHATTEAELAACLELEPDLLVLGDGANLLVADEGGGSARREARRRGCGNLHR